MRENQVSVPCIPSFFILIRCSLLHNGRRKVSPNAQAMCNDCLLQPAESLRDEIVCLSEGIREKLYQLHWETQDKSKIRIRKQLHNSSPKDAEDGASNTYSPLNAIKWRDTKGSTPNKNDENLPTYHQNIDPHEPVITVYTLEYVEFVVQSTAVQFVEYLHPHKSVEDNCIEFQLLLMNTGVVAQNLVTCKIQRETHCQLIDRLPYYHFPHCNGEQRRISWDRWSFQNLFSWGISCSGAR